MARTPEEEAEYQQLKAQIAQMPDDPVPVAEQSFASSFAGGKDSFWGNVGQWASDMVPTWDSLTPPFMKDAAHMALPMAEQLKRSTSPKAMAEIQDQMSRPLSTLMPGGVAEAIPGTVTAERLGAGLLSGDQMTWGETGQSLREEFAGVPAGLAAYGLAKGVPYAKRVATGFSEAPNAKADFMSQPNTQAAARAAYTRNPDIFGGTTPEKATLNSSTANALEAQQNLANEGAVKTAGLELGIAQDRGIGSRGARENWDSVAPVINDPAVVSAQTVPELVQIASTKKDVVGNTRHQFAQGFDQQGQVFRSDTFEPVLQELEQQAQRMEVAPEGVEFGSALREAVNDFRMWFRRRAGIGGIKPSEAIYLSENYNQYRRAQGEFNRRNQGAQAQGDVAAVMGDEVASEQLVPKLNQFVNSLMDGLADPTGQQKPFSALQEQYGGWSALEQQARDQAYQTELGQTRTDTRRLVKNAGNDVSASQALRNPVYTAVDRFWSNLRNKSSPESMQMLRETTRDADIMNNIRDYELLRQNPLDIGGMRALEGRNKYALKLEAATKAARGYQPGSRGGAMDYFSRMAPGIGIAAMQQQVDPFLINGPPPAMITRRDFSLIKTVPGALQSLAQKAEMMGLVSAQEFLIMSEPMQKQVHQMVISADPMSAERVPGGYNIIDGKFVDPMEKDAYMKENLDLPATERAQRNGAAFENKFLPSSDFGSESTPQPYSQGTFNMNKINDAFEFSMDFTAPSDTNRMLTQLEEMTSLHALDD